MDGKGKSETNINFKAHSEHTLVIQHSYSTFSYAASWRRHMQTALKQLKTSKISPWHDKNVI